MKDPDTWTYVARVFGLGGFGTPSEKNFEEPCRLAFAIAAFLEPDILIIDEVLAVGDAEFQRQCLGKDLARLAVGKRFH